MKRVLIVLLILVLLLSLTYTALESGHQCSGEAECPICKVIAVLSSIASFTVVCFLSVLFFSIVCLLAHRVTARKDAPSTLIDLGVKISA